jgi:DNA polymerase
LGAPAASSVIQKNFKISQDRGKWFSCRWAPAAIAAFHPAYILRNAGEAYNATYQTLVNDLLEARRKVIELKAAQEQQKPLPPPDHEQMRLF